MASIGISPSTTKIAKIIIVYIILTAKFFIHPQQHEHIVLGLFNWCGRISIRYNMIFI